MFSQIYFRIRSILFAVFFAAIGHSLLAILLPLSMSANNVSISIIGLAMSGFAIGQIIATIYGNKIIIKVGHIRIYANVASVIAIIAILHSYTDSIIFVLFGRVVVGICITIIFITLESWLNSTSDNSNRTSIFAIFHIVYGAGFATAPFLLSFDFLQGSNFFAITALVLCVSLLPLTLTYRVTPKIDESSYKVKISKIFSLSPAGTITTFMAGMLVGPAITLNAIYVKNLNVSEAVTSILLASNIIGSLVILFPIGVLADKFDKRTIASLLMVSCIIANALIVFYYFVPYNLIILIFLTLLSYGFVMCLYPLAVTQVFDVIDLKDAIPTSSTLLLIYSFGYLVGPIIAANVMEFFGSWALFAYFITINLLLLVAVLVRRVILNPKVVEEPNKFQPILATEATAQSALDPRNEYLLGEINSSAMAILIEALAQGVADPRKIIETAFKYVKYDPSQVASNLVYHLPRQSEIIMRAIVELYPEERVSIAKGLYDIFILNKKRINSLVIKGILYNANAEEEEEINSLLASIEDQIEVN